MLQLEIRTETGQDGHHLSHVLSSVSVSSLWYVLPKTATFLNQPCCFFRFLSVDFETDQSESVKDFVLAPKCVWFLSHLESNALEAAIIDT